MEKKTKLDLIKEGYEAARDNKPEKKYPIGHAGAGEPVYHSMIANSELEELRNKAAELQRLKQNIQEGKFQPPADAERVKFDSHWMIGRSEERFKELTHKDWDWRSFYNGWIEGRADAVEDIIKRERATPQGIGWVKASERMPKEAGPITWRWLDKEAAYSGFNGIAFIYDKGGAQVDMLYAIEIEWLDETGQSQQPGREVDKEVLDFIRDIAKNWDCDEDGHKYNTGCRKCSASELLYDLTRGKEVKPVVKKQKYYSDDELREIISMVCDQLNEGFNGREEFIDQTIELFGNKKSAIEEMRKLGVKHPNPHLCDNRESCGYPTCDCLPF